MFESPEPQTWVNWLVALFVSLFGWNLSTYRRKIDALEKGHAALLASYVSRTELEKDLLKIAEARKEMHAENTRKLERIEDSVTRLHGRIDEIPFRSFNARTRSSDP